MRELSISELEKVSGGVPVVDTIVVVGSPSLETKWGSALWLPTNFGNDFSHIADHHLDMFGEGGGGTVEENENNEEQECTTQTAPDGTEYSLPPGYTLFDKGPGQPQDHHYMVAPDGTIELTPWWAEKAQDNHQALSESAHEVASALGVTSLALIKWSPAASLVLGVAGVVAGFSAPPHAQPIEGGDSAGCGSQG